jgi:hypothetical protein
VSKQRALDASHGNDRIRDHSPSHHIAREMRRRVPAFLGGDSRRKLAQFAPDFILKLPDIGFRTPPLSRMTALERLRANPSVAAKVFA